MQGALLAFQALTFVALVGVAWRGGLAIRGVERGLSSILRSLVEIEARLAALEAVRNGGSGLDPRRDDEAHREARH
jgi:hypothetical protein